MYDESAGSLNSKDAGMEMTKSLLPRNKLAIIQQMEEGTVYQCVECPASYFQKEKMELHLLTHHKEYRFLCGLCGAGLKRKEHLDRHTLGHQEVRPHVCAECGKGFKRKEHLNIHRTIHTGEKAQVCPLCQRSFNRKDHLQKHLLTHNRQYMDALNDQGLVDLKQEIMEDDIKLELQDVEDMNNLVIDDSKRSTAGVPIAERPFACQFCKKTYKRRDHLKMHSVKHMPKNKVCSECGAAFRKEEQLLVHMNTHLRPHGLEPGGEDSHPIPVDHSHIDIAPINDLLVQREDRRPHECPVCLKRFKRRQHLKVHANVHARAPHPQPTIWCSLCSVGFSTNEQFEDHECVSDTTVAPPEQSGDQQRSAKKENQPHYVPPEFVDFSEAENASYEAQQQESLVTSQVEERLIPRPQRVYVCKYCAKPFRRKDHYKIHLHIHTGVKSFFCVDCGKGFYRKDHLQKHALVHEKSRAPPPRTRRAPPPLFPINMLKKGHDDGIKPEITITAPSNMKLRVPLQIKVPYQMVRVDAEPQHDAQ